MLREVFVGWTTAAEAAVQAQGHTETPPAPALHVRVGWAERVALDVDTGAYQAAVARAVAARGRAAAARNMPFGAMNVVVYDPPWGPDAADLARFRELDAALLDVRFPWSRIVCGSQPLAGRTWRPGVYRRGHGGGTGSAAHRRPRNGRLCVVGHTETGVILGVCDSGLFC